jgi:glucosamine--fructose-6-phosphate aminotransferase (isomerizing)
MCGIVGYTGKKPALDILVDGLRRLEYRGYDSAGLAMVNRSELIVIKAQGKIINLQEKLKDHDLLAYTTGISHTRWATHGVPSEKNSHPHTSTDGRIALVHNGIIENHHLIRKKLELEGVVFRSETDTEVIVHLISRYYQGDLEKAVVKALSKVEGAFGIAVVCADHPDLLIGARRGSPLIVGIAEDGIYLGSDVAPMVNHTQNVIYLNDNDVVIAQNNQYRIINLLSQEVKREVQQVDFDLSAIAKSGFDHFMLKEIFEQADTVRNAQRGRLLINEGTAKLDGLALNIKELRSIDRIIILACGTSYYAGMVGEYLLEDLAGIPVEVEYASEFRYRNPIIGSNTIVFCISQSGETADTLAAAAEAKRKGATVLGICNVVGSSIARMTDGGVYLHAGPEIGVASTKAFTSQVTVLAMIALMLGRMRRISPEAGCEIAAAMENLPAQIEEILALNDQIRTIAGEYQKATNFLYLGRHFNYPVAMEGALKLKEISYIHAEGYPAAEMKHGPIALIDENMPVVVIAPKDALFDKILSNVQETKARGGRIIAVTSGDSSGLDQHADHIIRIPETLPMLMPILTCIPLQMLAYHIAVLRGNDVDQPRNLAKSVTVE